jgi:hypothetical protein
VGEDFLLVGSYGVHGSPVNWDRFGPGDGVCR